MITPLSPSPSSSFPPSLHSPPHPLPLPFFHSFLPPPPPPPPDQRSNNGQSRSWAVISQVVSSRDRGRQRGHQGFSGEGCGSLISTIIHLSPPLHIYREKLHLKFSVQLLPMARYVVAYTCSCLSLSPSISPFLPLSLPPIACQCCLYAIALTPPLPPPPSRNQAL